MFQKIWNEEIPDDNKRQKLANLLTRVVSYNKMENLGPESNHGGRKEVVRSGLKPS